MPSRVTNGTGNDQVHMLLLRIHTARLLEKALGRTFLSLRGAREAELRDIMVSSNIFSNSRSLGNSKLNVKF